MENNKPLLVVPDRCPTCTVETQSRPSSGDLLEWVGSPFFLKQSVATLGVLKVVVKDGCLIEVSSGRPCNSLLLQYIHSPRYDGSAFRLRRLAETGGPAWALFKTALSLCCCAHVRTFLITFLGRRRGNLVFWLSKVDFS